jgi:outer membrane protein OmpA-like peptidoglycan-associated protein
MRRAALTLLSLAFTTASAAAQISSAPNTVPGTEASPFPVLNMPSQLDTPADRYRHLPSRDLGNAISIQVASAALYDFNLMQMNSRAEDYLQQTANLIFEKAKGPVRIECRSDRGAPAAAQKLGAQCAAAVAQWLTVQEKLTKVKFVTVGSSVPPPAPPDPHDLMAKPSPSLASITIDFAKK